MRKLFLFLMLLFPSLAFAQAGGIITSGIIVLSSSGRPVAGATVTVCNVSDMGVPCTQLVNIFQDAALTIPAANPGTTDANGNFVAFATPAVYHYTVSGNGVTGTGQPFTATVSTPSAGGGNVLSGGNNNMTGNNTFTGQNKIAAYNLNNIVTVDGIKYTTLNAALADPVCSGTAGCTIDMRGNNSGAALALGAFDPGSSKVTLLLGPYAYSTSGITIESYFGIYGAARGSTTIQSTSTTAPIFTLGGSTAVYSFHLEHAIIYCGAGNSSQVAFNIVAQAGGGGLNNSDLKDVSIGGDGVHECGGESILLDGSNGGSPPAINQFLNFTNVQAFRKSGGAPAFHARGVNGQIYVYGASQFDGPATRDTLPNVVVEDSAFSGFAAAYSILFSGTTIQRAGIGIKLRGVTDFVCDTCHFENLSGIVNAAIGQNYGNRGVTIRNSYCAVNCGVNSGAGYLVTIDSHSQLNFDNNSIQGTPDNFWLGTLTSLEHQGLRDFGSDALYTAPNSSQRIPVGIDCDSPGFKCATAAVTAITAGAYAEVDITWTTPFVDASYVPLCVVYDGTSGTTSAGLRFDRLAGSGAFLSPSGLKAVVFNASGGTLSGSLLCTATHI